ncbi:uncharacterized protein LOC117325789 [Pecten maximus]|uniref:uncharacterized protein LOC117325789 n=1 Tax=Pecten maximus TaxID=6579 RepID=UPI001458E70C|nr:uncharacterized protein LOC117325789 [Pecten maximus]
MEEQYMSKSVSMDSLLSEDNNQVWNQYVHFYHERMATRERLKKHIPDNQSGPGNINNTVLDTAMETLRREMAAVIDNDLALSKQLLVLHETIEDLLTGDDDCESSDACSEINLCDSCTLSQTILVKPNKTSSVSDHQKYSSIDSDDVVIHTPAKQHQRRNDGGHQKQNSNDSGFCFIFQDLEVTI